ncbi:hypothetical protein PHYBOEH_000472 [Phytophthora boehmeriae]|uniref:UDENN domain-containing protein n=1 Tax=Phytophthora boehmeriae TaxID=109152 RepID=A0A8T1WVX2_9STRA|nr:hypothetical protein PHYBOEH_000472 [Phytophthora boehmeriae]
MWLPVGQGNGLGTENSSGGLCVTSKFPLADSMRHFLRSLRQLIDTYQKSTQEEDAVTPFPVTGVVEDAVHGMSDYLFSRLHEPDDNDSLPAIDFQLGDLFDSLSLTHILRLFAFVLLEKKIVLVASSYTVLFNVSEALRVLLHPLVWSHLYVPILPIALKDCLHCPTPFIFGLHDSYVRRSQMPRPSADLVVVNLDRDSLTGGGEVILPPVRQSMLREELFRLCKPHLFSRDSIDSFETNSSPSGSFPTRAVRCLFRKHVREILTSLEPCVNRFEFNDQSVCVVDSINASQWPADAQRFCSTLLLTQAVSTYLATTTSTWM